MISFGPVVDDGVSSRREREEICFSKRVTFEFREVFRKLATAVNSCLSWSKRAAAVGIAIQSPGLTVRRALCGFRRCPSHGDCGPFGSRPTLPTVRHGRRPEPVLRILRLPFDRYGARPPEILRSFVNRAEPTHFSARSIGNLALSPSDGSAQPLLVIVRHWSPSHQQSGE